MKVLESDQLKSLHRSQATCLRGDLYGRQGQRDYQKAIQYHLDGIKQVKSLVSSSDGDVRSQARRILLDAHLAIANDIAWGDWQNKATVIPKWLSISETLLDSLLNHASEDPAISLYVQQQTLSAYMGVGGELDGEQMVEALTKTYNELMESDSDALFKQKVRWMTGSALYCAGRIAQQQGKSQDALRNATDAHHLLTAVAEDRDVVPRSEILVGDACFLIGSLHAVYKNDHSEAVKWYRESLQGYEQPVVAEQIMNLGLHGERLVSMGLSFWQSGDHQRGLQLTRDGTAMIEKAVEKQDYQSQVLAVPYGNLVAMYRHLEDEKLSQQFAERAIQLKQEKQAEETVAEDSPAEQNGEKPDSDAAEEKPGVEKKEADSTGSATPAEEKKEPVTTEAGTEPEPAEKPTAVKSEPPAKEKEPVATEAGTEPEPAEKPTAVKSEPPAKEKEPVATQPAAPEVPDNPIRKSKKSE
jgi:tetratricopeptide (TPR) repeat protein